MRRSHALVLVCGSVFCTALALPPRQQQEPLAEQQFKNIRSFTGIKASEVIPAMKFMSAALKVECNFCHVEGDWSKDKQEKRTTRNMIAMQKDINEKYFGGNTEVTCATCHNGHERPVSVSPVPGLDARVRRNADMTAQQIFDAYAKASGGEAPGMRIEGQAVENGKSGKFSAVTSGNKFTFMLNAAKGEQKMGYNGDQMWFVMPDRVQMVPYDHAKEYINERKIFAGVASLPKLTQPFPGKAVIDGKDQDVVVGRVEGDDRTRVNLYFDHKTGLLTRTVFFYGSVLGNMAQSNDYSNYKKVGAAMIPTMIVNHSGDHDLELKLTSIKVDPKIDAASFEAPKK